MQVATILEEIKHLTLDKKLYIVEETVKSIKHNENLSQLNIAVEELLEEYKTNSELTSFISLDIENFYETK